MYRVTYLIQSTAVRFKKFDNLKECFEFEVMRLMSEIMAHTITLHMLDAPGRVERFLRKYEDLFELLPKKELAAYLNLSPETLSRLNFPVEGLPAITETIANPGAAP